MLLVLLAAFAGCGSHDRSGPTARVAEQAPPTTIATIDDPYAVPQVIDVAYINQVLAALDHIYGEAIRTLVRDRAVTPQFTDLMRSIYTEEQLHQITDLAAHARDKGFSTMSPTPADPKTVVQRVLRASVTCIFVAVDRELSPVSAPGPTIPVPQNYIALQRSADSPAARDPNPTIWRMAYEGFRPDGSEPAVRCA